MNSKNLVWLFSLILTMTIQPAWSKDQVISKSQVKNSKSLALKLKSDSFVRINFHAKDVSKLKIGTGGKAIGMHEFTKGQKLSANTDMFLSKSAHQMPISSKDAQRLESLDLGESITVQSGNGDVGDLECWCKPSGYGCRVIGF